MVSLAGCADHGVTVIGTLILRYMIPMRSKKNGVFSFWSPNTCLRGRRYESNGVIIIRIDDVYGPVGMCIVQC